jgi:pilus assembly protein Flp/PilA
MTQKLKTWMALRSDRRAVTALEYGLIAALIAVVIIGSVTALGTNISTAFSKVASSIAGAK